MAVSLAAKVAQRPEDEQREIVERVREGALPIEAARQVTAARIEQKRIEQPTGKFRVIYADPPWSYGNSMPPGTTTPDDYYPTMSTDAICALPIRELAEDNAVLFMWTTSPHLEESFRVIKAWGFEYKSSFVWDKVAHNMGHYNSVRHEFLLVCVRGSCQPDVRKLFDSVVTEERREHSRKPDVFYEIIETIYTRGAKVELFARRPREGWSAWGYEAEARSA
jgi:N6-adenosine-specific RNA methylase IME4